MNHKWKSWISVLVLVAVMIILSSDTLLAQCPMCRMSAESNLENGGSSGKGLNAGILYMLSAPYLIVAAVAYIWWKNRKKEEGIEA